jgi:hypothetical protein
MGAAGIAAIVGGALAAGGAAVAAAGGGPTTTLPPAVSPSSYSVTLSDQPNCGSAVMSVSRSGTLTARVAISPPLRCIKMFCFGTGSLGESCLNTKRTLVDGETLSIPNVTSRSYQLLFCDCEDDPAKRVPMTVTVTATLN